MLKENTMAGSKAWYYTAVHYVTDEYRAFHNVLWDYKI
jgi:hypothetical protein